MLKKNSLKLGMATLQWAALVCEWSYCALAGSVLQKLSEEEARILRVNPSVCMLSEEAY